MSSTSAELGGVYYSLEHLRQYQPTDWRFLTDYRSALLSLCISESKTTNPILRQDVLNINDYLYQHGHSIKNQWIPSHVGIHGNELADKSAAAPGSSTSLSTIPVGRTDSKFIIKDNGRNLNGSLWNSGLERRGPIQLDPEVKLKTPSNISREHQSVIHRLRLGVGFTGRYLHRRLCAANLKWVTTSRTHYIRCTRYNTERIKMER